MSAEYAVITLIDIILADIIMFTALLEIITFIISGTYTAKVMSAEYAEVHILRIIFHIQI